MATEIGVMGGYSPETLRREGSIGLIANTRGGETGGVIKRRAAHQTGVIAVNVLGRYTVLQFIEYYLSISIL